MGMQGIRGGTPTKPKHTEESIQQALNMKNFIKRLRRQGIIGADENVKIVK